MPNISCSYVKDINPLHNICRTNTVPDLQQPDNFLNWLSIVYSAWDPPLKGHSTPTCLDLDNYWYAWPSYKQLLIGPWPKSSTIKQLPVIVAEPENILNLTLYGHSTPKCLDLNKYWYVWPSYKQLLLGPTVLNSQKSDNFQSRILQDFGTVRFKTNKTVFYYSSVLCL